MSDTFFEKSKEIANDYIQSVVFLDDRAYKSIVDEAKPNNSFDTYKISQSFAKSEKICAVYQPKSQNDIDNFKAISVKADVVILDWEINFPKVVDAGNEEEDDDHEAGVYTKSIIKSALFDDNKPNQSLKVITVYTGDYAILKNIITEIYEEIFNYGNTYKLDEDNLTISASNFKIFVRAKVAKINVETNRHLEKFMVSYEDMPQFILDGFTSVTSGLLSNFALMSLTTLRKNSSKILALFSKEMDNAFLSHKALLPSQEDAEDLLIYLLGDTISDLLFYNKTNETTRSQIEDWVKANIIEENKELLKKDGSRHNPIENYSRNHKLIFALINSQNKDVEKRYEDVFTSIANTSKTRIGEYYKHISLNNTSIFLNNTDEAKKDTIDKKFSILTHHKSLFIPNSSIPKLTLGTVVKSSTIADSFYICIQQKCDSVRITNGSERKFLFIPLTVSLNRFDIITPDGVKLRRVKDSFSIRTIKFVCNNDNGVIKAEKESETNKYFFKQKYEDEQFEWILDLKDLHSQRIIIDYTTQLSRVGLDESEWHRRFLS